MRVTKHLEEVGSSNWHPAARSFGRCAPSRMVMVINPCWRNEFARDEASGGAVGDCSPPPDPSVAALPPGWTCAGTASPSKDFTIM